MATPNTQTFNKYYGNGSTTEFSISFPYFKKEYVKVYVKRTGLEEVVVPSTEYEFVNESTIRFPSNTSSLDVLREGDVITIQRETTVESGYDFSNQKRLFPEDVMGADDLAFQILQEQERQLGRSIVFGATSDAKPDVVLKKVEGIYESIDDISNVSNNISSIKTVSNNIDTINDVTMMSDYIENVSNNMPYIIGVEENKFNINGVYNSIDDITVVSRISNSVERVSNSMNSVINVADNNANIKTVSSNISSINTCSSNISAIKDAPNQANRAKQYADQAQALTEGSLNETQITNCITEIPQDIKLELNNGTLTLKAGSKVYVPNGAGVFDAVNIASDITYTRTDNQDCAVFYNRDTATIQAFPIVIMYSGETAPTGIGTFAYWYDTANNLCKVTGNGGSNWVSNKSFPLGVVSTDGTKISAIKQVFNGFGYIGSTIFALPGVKGLIPNGRNADSTLKNTEYTVPNVITFERNLTGDNIPVFLRGNNTFAISTGLLYDEANNIVGTGGYFQVGNVDMNAGVISKFQPKTTFHAVDYKDFKRLDDEAVKKTGDQIIGGYKRFLNTATFYNNSTNNFKGFLNAQESRFVIGTMEAGSTTFNPASIYFYKDRIEVPTPSSATDNSSKIATTAWVNNAKSMIVGWSIPDRAKAVSVSTGASYTAPSNGWLYVNIIGQKSTYEKIEIDIGGFKYNYGRSLYDNQNEDITAEILISKGDVCTFNVTGTWTVKFIPCKGV